MAAERVARLRCGVGGGAPKADVGQYVLQAFGADERERVEALITRAAEACEAWIAQGIEVAMNQYNTVQES